MMALMFNKSRNMISIHRVKFISKLSVATQIKNLDLFMQDSRMYELQEASLEKYNITFDIDNIISKVEENFVIASEEIENVLLQVSFAEEIEVPEENEIAILEEVDVDKANQENI